MSPTDFATVEAFSGPIACAAAAVLDYPPNEEDRAPSLPPEMNPQYEESRYERKMRRLRLAQAEYQLCRGEKILLRNEAAAQGKFSRGMMLAMSRVRCTQCHGSGVHIKYRKELIPCDCVWRAVFRACLNRWREIRCNGSFSAGRINYEHIGRGRNNGGRGTYGMKRIEYLADFELTAKRSLDESQYRLFRLHFIAGADWKICCIELRMDRGQFFYTVYGVEQKLGRAFLEQKPFGLYPLDEYFASIRRDITASAIAV